MSKDTENARAIQHLRAHGPTPRPEVPGSLTIEGVRSMTNSLRVDGTQYVVYLDEHDSRAVLRTWAQMNRTAAEGMGSEVVRRRVRRAGRLGGRGR